LKGSWRDLRVFDVEMTPRSTGENFGCGPMAECEGGQNAFGVTTEFQQLDTRLGGVRLQEPSQCSTSLMEWAEARIVYLGCVRDGDGHGWLDDPKY